MVLLGPLHRRTRRRMPTLGMLLCRLSLQGTSVQCLFLSTLVVNVSLNSST